MNDSANAQTGITSRPQQRPLSLVVSLLTPKLWKLMLLGAVPLFLLCCDFFEHIERSSYLGSFFSAMLLQTTILGFGIMTVVLYRRDL